jgi:hypothetical protein
MYDHDHDDGTEDMQAIDMKLAAIEHREGGEARKEMTLALMDDNPVLAKAFYHAYSNLVDAGFDECQALEIIIRRGWHLSEGG